MNTVEVVEHFFGVYLLYCMNPKYKGKVYIGYTVNPRRRINQHNAGMQFGGARKTNNKGPWNMILIVHGFPNSTSALRFEWAWQHPKESRRLKNIPKMKPRQKIFDYHLMLLSEMLKLGPWCRLPLTLRWLDHTFSENYASIVSPPLHMPISYGKVLSKSLNDNSSKKKKIHQQQQQAEEPEIPLIMSCSICHLYVNARDKVMCINANCHLIAHLICLANIFTKDTMLLPVTGDCPACNTNVLWGDLIRKKLGCNLHLENTDAKSDDSDDDLGSLSD